MLSNGLVTAEPFNKEEYPIIYYDFKNNDIGCEYDGQDNFFNCDRSERYKTLNFAKEKLILKNLILFIKIHISKGNAPVI